MVFFSLFFFPPFLYFFPPPPPPDQISLTVLYGLNNQRVPFVTSLGLDLCDLHAKRMARSLDIRVDGLPAWFADSQGKKQEEGEKTSISSFVCVLSCLELHLSSFFPKRRSAESPKYAANWASLPMTGNARWLVFDRGDGHLRVLDFLPPGVPSDARALLFADAAGGTKRKRSDSISDDDDDDEV